MGILDKFKKKTDIKEDLAKVEKNAPSKEVGEKKPKKTAKQSVLSTTKGTASYASRLIVRPLISEKATTQESKNQYTFVVDAKANKTLVKQAVMDLYGVRPVAVRVVNVMGKKARFGKTSGKRKDWKKAIVKLPAGKTIHIHEGV